MAQKDVQKNKSAKTDKKKSKLTSFAWGCWGLFVIVIILAFIVKKDTIVSNLKSTDFFGRLFGSTPQFIKNHNDDSDFFGNQDDENGENPVIVLKSEKKVKKSKTENKEKKSIEKQPSKAETSKSENKEKIEKADDVKDTSGVNVKAPAKESAKQIDSENVLKQHSAPEKETDASFKEPQIPERTKETVASPVTEKATGTTEIFLYFVFIDSDGRVSRREVKRNVSKNDSPLTTAIKLLLAGPDASAKAEKDAETLIPEGTKLLGARVQNGVAYLDFNENFEFNAVGIEGYRHQLEQIVFTATAFPTVKSVQFLIEGEKTEYLGSEGMWIGSPLSRSSF